MRPLRRPPPAAADLAAAAKSEDCGSLPSNGLLESFQSSFCPGSSKSGVFDMGVACRSAINNESLREGNECQLLWTIVKSKKKML